MKTQCTTCGGVYPAVDDDGAAYFHTCAPLRRLRVDNGDGTFSTVVPGTEGARRIVGEKFVDRPNARNENVVQNPATGAVTIVAPGNGTTVVNDNVIP